MKLTLPRALGLIGSAMLAMTGASAMIDAASHPQPLARIVLGACLIVVGYLGMRAAQSGYRGGLYSFLGVFFVLAAIYDVMLFADPPGSGGNGVPELLALVAMACGGVLLLKAGHARHRRSEPGGARWEPFIVAYARRASGVTQADMRAISGVFGPLSPHWVRLAAPEGMLVLLPSTQEVRSRIEAIAEDMAREADGVRLGLAEGEVLVERDSEGRIINLPVGMTINNAMNAAL